MDLSYSFKRLDLLATGISNIFHVPVEKLTIQSLEVFSQEERFGLSAVVYNLTSDVEVSLPFDCFGTLRFKQEVYDNLLRRFYFVSCTDKNLNAGYIGNLTYTFSIGCQLGWDGIVNKNEMDELNQEIQEKMLTEYPLELKIEKFDILPIQLIKK
jgi:hypothetical protein